MKRMITRLVALTFAVAVIAINAGDKVSICHMPPNGMVLMVGVQALPGHLDHGDFVSETCE